MWSRVVWFGLLVVALGAALSTPVATSLAMCEPLAAVSAAPALTGDQGRDAACADSGLASPLAGTPELTRC